MDVSTRWLLPPQHLGRQLAQWKLLRLFEVDHCLSRLGESPLLSRHPLDSFWVFPQIADGAFHLKFLDFLCHHFRFQREDIVPHPLVLLEYGQIPEKNPQQACRHDQYDHELRQPMPNPEINFFAQVSSLKNSAP